MQNQINRLDSEEKNILAFYENIYDYLEENYKDGTISEKQLKELII